MPIQVNQSQRDAITCAWPGGQDAILDALVPLVRHAYLTHPKRPTGVDQAPTALLRAGYAIRGLFDGSPPIEVFIERLERLDLF